MTNARENFEQLFFDYGVDLVFNGHVHATEISLPVYNGTVLIGKTDDKNPYENAGGTVHYVSGNPSCGEGTSVFMERQNWTALTHSSTLALTTMPGSASLALMTPILFLPASTTSP